MYLHAFLYKYQFPNETSTNSDIKTKLQERYKNEGIEIMYKELTDINPELKDTIHINNHKRVLRNLEILIENGQKPTDLKKQSKTIRKTKKT